MVPFHPAYVQQTRWSDPGRHAAALGALSPDPAFLPAAFAGLLMHPVSAAALGLNVPVQARADKELRRTEDLLSTILSRNPGPLDQPREPRQRCFGVCRHYALLAVAVLRAAGVPARVRVGFAFYFAPGFGDDHWLCEFHDGARWRLLDAELDPATQARLGIAFDPTDVPRTSFVPAGLAWQQLRTGQVDGEALGVSAIGVRGAWFAAGSLLRDAATLAGHEAVLPWDYWGPSRALGPRSAVPPEWLAPLDALAGDLAAEPLTPEEAAALFHAHPWAAMPPSVTSYPRGEAIEVPIT